MPQSAPIASGGEEICVPGAIPKKDDEKRPYPNPGMQRGPGF